MPYIDAENRKQYDAAACELMELATVDNFYSLFASFVFGVGEQIYGGPTETRYFKQNELGGVLICAALEWRRRAGGSLAETFGVTPAFRDQTEASARRVARMIPREDEGQRPGHLNYCLTRILIDAIGRECLATDNAPSLLLATLSAWYSEVTGPYEEIAITKNGDCYPSALRKPCAAA